MKIDYCEVHRCAYQPGPDFYMPPGVCLYESEFGPEGEPCRMVPMRLIPDNEETVDREALLAAVQHLVEEFGPSREWPDGDPEWDDYQPLAVAARAWLALDGETP